MNLKIFILSEQIQIRECIILLFRLYKTLKKMQTVLKELISCCLGMKGRTEIWEGITKGCEETLMGHVEVHYFVYMMVVFL